ncbi:hypothetical protein BJP36_36625 [Moorena producens JHB]|uniref:Uncharacterized protein n=1 Tax=Moorena producens (strain JHB) TaxID=1454205 RepID=A0A9Q9STZ4_MOOP1|nr:hypothetical protein [Moorena producens]WAN69622.1 hypothetical protein BJP36_36625 [Moorena producens JHB]
MGRWGVDVGWAVVEIDSCAGHRVGSHCPPTINLPTKVGSAPQRLFCLRSRC